MHWGHIIQSHRSGLRSETRAAGIHMNRLGNLLFTSFCGYAPHGSARAVSAVAAQSSWQMLQIPCIVSL
jgi:hypothetical protein